MAKYDSQPPEGSYRSSAWWDKALGNKADKEWVMSEMKTRDQMIGQAKSIAMEAKTKAEKPHSCVHEEEFGHMKNSVEGLLKWRMGGIVGVIVLIISAVANYVSLNNSVANTKVEVTEVKQNQKEMQIDVTAKIDSLKVKMDQSEKAQVRREVQQQQDLKQSLKEAVSEALEDTRPSRRRNTN